MFKELSRQITFIVLIYICVCSSAEAQPGNSMLEKLEARLSAYKDAFRSNDYVRAASFVSPNMINKIGGEENFARLVQKFTDSTIMTLDPSLIKFSKPEEIVSYDNVYISVVKKMIPVTTKGVDEELKDTYLMFNPTFPAAVFEGMDGVFTISIVAFSNDEGNTWFFTGGNKMSLGVENIELEILEKIDIPVPTLIFGEGNDLITLYRQNKQWVRKESGISGGLAEESIILTLGEQMEGSLPNMIETEIPDDSLDAYIYLEEHPDEYSDIPGAIASPGKEDSIKKGYESKQALSKDTLFSVFVTKESNIFHKPDCPELGTGDLLEFDSPQEALEAGGIPCEHCNP